MNIWTPGFWDKRLSPGDDLIVVDDRVFVLGLDELYRNAMKGFEGQSLLPCARRVANMLQVRPADVPIEGYYHETPELKEYFCLMRSLQEVNEARETEVRDLDEFQRLWELTNSPLYGRPQRKGKLLPVGRDPLSQALLDTRPDWRLGRLVRATYDIAQGQDDFSLVGLAARTRDAVLLTAVRETIVLYAEVMTLGIATEPEFRCEWRVDADLAEAANRFIDTFNRFVPGALPRAEAANAEQYAKGYVDNGFIGRCVRIGKTPDDGRHYHWAIVVQEISPAGLELCVDEFWSERIWTTEKYREVQRDPAHMKPFTVAGVPESPLDWL